ncbi:hypothetical protein [Sulfidibacter corallicola]
MDWRSWLGQAGGGVPVGRISVEETPSVDRYWEKFRLMNWKWSQGVNFPIDTLCELTLGFKLTSIFFVSYLLDGCLSRLFSVVKGDLCVVAQVFYWVWLYL